MANSQVPLTAGEIALVLQGNRNNVATRLSELEHLGVVRKWDEKECPTTKKICWAWVLTGSQPTGEIPRSINTTEIVRGQRDKALKKVEQFEEMVEALAVWLENPTKQRNHTHYTRTAKRIRERMAAIQGAK